MYEKESAYFFNDSSAKIIHDDTFARLLSFYNVYVTSVNDYHLGLIPADIGTLRSGHQAYLTEEALKAIAETTIYNLKTIESTGTCDNIVSQ